MRIKSADTLAGVPMMQIRKALKASLGAKWTIGNVQTALKTSRARAVAVVAALLEDDLIVELESAGRARQFRTTTKGLALGSATASAPIRRRTAERLLNEFLERVRIVNANDDYLYRVKTVVLFGSYLSSSHDLGDIDIAYALEQRGRVDWDAAAEACSQRAEDAGRRFRTMLERIFWPEQEVVRFLRSRSKSLRLVELESHRKLLLTTAHQTLLGTFP